MSDNITLNVKELFDQINKIKNDGMNYVDLTILDEEEFEGDLIPKTLSLTAYKHKDDCVYFDYEMIEQPK